MVEEGRMCREESVDDGVSGEVEVEAVRCFPAWTRRKSAGGREVRNESS